MINQGKNIKDEKVRLGKEPGGKNSVEEFIYTVSHDLRAPLITVKGFIKLLRKAYEKNDRERVYRYMQRIDLSAETMEHRLQALLELSRIGRMINAKEENPFTEIVKRTLDMMKVDLIGAKMNIEVQENLPLVYGDVARVTQALQNLIENAVKFMGEQNPPRIQIGADFKKNEQPVFYVRDNGIGLDPEYFDIIFEIFHKLDPKSNGMGIGLAFVKRIVDLHGGNVWVESEGLNKGCKFCFTLPSGNEQI